MSGTPPRCSVRGCDRPRYGAAVCAFHARRGRFGALDLLERILWQQPSLPDASCHDHSPAVFDGEDPEDVAAALEICNTCPELAPCRRWASQLNKSHKAVGVIGGRHYRPKDPEL